MADVADAKRPVTALAGPYGHPFHPALVTVPIGAWVASLVFDLASREAHDPVVFATGSAWLIGVGLVGAVVAAGFGLLDLLAIPPGTRVWRVGLAHMSCNLTATTLFAVAWFVRRDDVAPATGTSWPHLLISLVALVVLSAGGYLGGELAYRYGVRVADEETQASGYTAPGGAGPTVPPATHSTRSSRRS